MRDVDITMPPGGNYAIDSSGPFAHIAGVSVRAPNADGVQISGRESVLEDLEIDMGVTGSGVTLGSGADDSRLSRIRVGRSYHGLWITGVARVLVEDVVIQGSSDHAIRIGSNQDVVFKNVLVAGSAINGIWDIDSHGMALLNVTVANTAEAGIYLTGSDDTTLSGVASVGSGGEGIRHHPDGAFSYIPQRAVYANVETTDHAGYGLFVYRLGDSVFRGRIAISGAGDDCYVDNSGITGSGIDDTATGVSNCVLLDETDATLAGGVSTAADYVAKVSANDAVNASDNSGARAHDDITDFLGFENEQRVWGVDGAAAFPDASLRGVCVTGQTCRIYDWSLQSGTSADVPLPDGDDVLVHRWSATDQAGCDQLDGTLAVDVCTTTHLRGAVELSDGVGNDNGLCESYEECLYSPNIGAYQGHGDLTALTFSDGRVVGVTLFGYTQQGR